MARTAGICSSDFVTRYFFHVENDLSSLRDEEGVVLADRVAACVEARRTIGAVIAEEIGAGHNAVHLAIMVDDETGIRVADIKAVATVVITENPLIL